MTKLSFVASPLFVDCFVGAAIYSHHLAHAIIHPDVAAVAANGADPGARFQVPRPGAESIFRRRQCTDGANLNDIAGELRGELRHLESRWLHLCAAESECELGISRNLFRESNASTALNASLQIQGDIFAQRKRL